MNDKSLHSMNCQQTYIMYAPILLGFAGKFVAGFNAEDIVHDVFLKLWERQVFLLPEDEIRKILFVSVRNACIDYLRRLNLEREVLDSKAIQLKLDELDFVESHEQLYMQNDLFNMLMQKIDELPDRSKEIFKLSYIHGMKSTEIADQMGISVRTVENQLYRALVFLRKKCSHLYLYIFHLLLQHMAV